MVQAYNFLASWQLFPEKCTYEKGIAPKSGSYKIETTDNDKKLTISYNWVTIENEAFYTQFDIIPDGEQHGFRSKEIASTYMASITNSYTISITFYTHTHQVCLEILKEIMPNGYLKITKKAIDSNGIMHTDIDIYHKQMSVLPYSNSVSGVAIRPTKQGVIKHKALMAMEEQTNMQLDQIKQQIELLARQAQELKQRKELSLMIYESKLSFKPQIGQIYHLYEKNDGSHHLSLVAPQEWGKNGPFKAYVSSVKLLADHTWVEMLN
jgi:predicted transcriptional regulator